MLRKAHAKQNLSVLEVSRRLVMVLAACSKYCTLPTERGCCHCRPNQCQGEESASHLSRGKASLLGHPTPHAEAESLVDSRPLPCCPLSAISSLQQVQELGTRGTPSPAMCPHPSAAVYLQGAKGNGLLFHTWHRSSKGGGGILILGKRRDYNSPSVQGIPSIYVLLRK